MITVKRDTTGKPKEMSAKKWGAMVESLQASSFQRAIRRDINRVIRKVVEARRVKSKKSARRQ